MCDASELSSSWRKDEHKTSLSIQPSRLFPRQSWRFSEEQGERFHQDIRTMEERYQGRWDVHMMADYCWTLIRIVPNKAIGGNLTTELSFT